MSSFEVVQLASQCVGVLPKVSCDDWEERRSFPPSNTAWGGFGDDALSHHHVHNHPSRSEAHPTLSSAEPPAGSVLYSFPITAVVSDGHTDIDLPKATQLLS